MSELQRHNGMDDFSLALVEIAEHLDVQAYSVHRQIDSPAIAIMLTLTGTAGVFAVRDRLRGRLQ